MDGAAFWDALEELVQQARWDEIDALASQTASARTHSRLVREAMEISTAGYESALAQMLEEATKKLNKKIKALYWEFDLDNGWDSLLLLSPEYKALDAGWIGSGDSIDGPGFGPFAELHQRSSRLSGAGSMAMVDLLAGRTIAAFGRAHERVGPRDRPVVTAFHDSSLQIHMPRPGVDLGKEREKGARKRRVPPPEKWYWLQGHTESLPLTRLGLARLISAETPEFEQVSGAFRIEVHPVADWDEPEFELDEGDLADVQPTHGMFPLFSDRLKEILESHSSPDDPVQWLPATVQDSEGCERRRYWIPHLTRIPGVIDLDRCDYHKENWQIQTVVFDADKLEDYGIIPSMQGVKIDPRIDTSNSPLSLAGVVIWSMQRDAVLISAEAASAVAKADCTGIEWAKVKTEVPELPPHLMENYGPPAQLRRA